MKRVDIVSFEASSGHKSAAEALRYALATAHPDWSVRIVDLGDVLKCQTRVLSFVYTAGIHFFNWCMRREQYFFFPTSIRLWIIFARLNTRWRPLNFLLRWTSEFWTDCSPDVIVSVTPMKHTIVYEAARHINRDVQCITIPVDYCEMTNGYWFQPEIKQHYFVGCEKLRNTALAHGVCESDLRELSGMVIDPRFYETCPIDRSEILSSLKLDPTLPVGVISFGGQGTVNVLACAKRISEAEIPTNLICLCGRNEKLLNAVRSLKTPYPIVALGFTADPPVTVHRVADFLIGKPGTMTLTEALITDTPLIFIKSQGLSIVQGANEAWVLEHEIGVMAESPETVDAAVRNVLNDPEIHDRIRKCQHRGIFDAVTEIDALVGDVSVPNQVASVARSTPLELNPTGASI